MRKTIKGKIAWLTVLALTVIVLCFTIFIYAYLEKWMVSQEMKSASLRATQIVRAYQSHLQEGVAQQKLTTPSWLAELVHGRQLALVFDAGGRWIDRAGSLQFPAVSHSLPAMHSAVLVMDGHHYARVVLGVYSRSGNRIGTVVFYTSLSMVYRYLQDLMKALIMGAMGAIVLAWFSGYWLSSVALRPIQKMMDAVALIDATRVTERLPISEGHDETSLLAERFNHLLARIQSAIDKQNRFVADASHELRTPLTVLRGYTDLLERWGQEDPAAVAKAVGAINKQLRQLHGLTDDLLQLASVHDLNPPQVALDIRTVVQEAVEYMAVGHDRDIKLIAPSESVMAAIYPQHLQQVLYILLNNSTIHTSQDVPIRVTVWTQRRSACVRVEDAGQGIAPEDLEHIFERFYRVDKARTRGAGTGGTGLGLAIAKELMEAYGGSIEATSDLGRGTVMTVCWPMARATVETPGPSRSSDDHDPSGDQTD